LFEVQLGSCASAMGKHAEFIVVDLVWAEEDQYSPDHTLAGLIVMSCLCWMLMLMMR
jgi:hypothetical protein